MAARCMDQSAMLHRRRRCDGRAIEAARLNQHHRRYPHRAEGAKAAQLTRKGQ